MFGGTGYKGTVVNTTAGGGAQRWVAPTLAGCLVLAAVIGVVLMEHPSLVSQHVLHQARDAVLVTGAALALGAGLLHLAVWRVDRAPRRARVGVALVVFGLFTSVTAFFGRIFHLDETAAVLCPFTALVGTLVVIGLAFSSSARSVELVERRPVLMWASSLIVTVGAIVLPAVAHAALTWPSAMSTGTHLALELVGAGAWFTTAVVHRRQRSVPGGHGVTASVLVAVGFVWLFRAAAVGLALDAWSFAAVVLLAATSVVTVTIAMVEFTSVADSEQERLGSTEEALEEVARAFAALESERRGFAHDAHNVLLALQAASQTLARHGDQLDPEVRRRMRQAIVDELAHLDDLLLHATDRSSSPVHTEVDVAEVVSTVAAAERSNGLDVRLDLQPCRALANPHETARVVRNLLVNARQHAAGSPVVVRVREAAGQVRVVVEDFGPGVPPSMRANVFDEGVTSKTGDGGLGLHISRVLARRQGGDLVLDPRGSGARFVLSLRTQPERNATVPVPRMATAGSTFAVPARRATA